MRVPLPSFRVWLYAGFEAVFCWDQGREPRLLQGLDYVIGECQTDHTENEALGKRDSVIAKFPVVLLQCREYVEQISETVLCVRNVIAGDRSFFAVISSWMGSPETFAGHFILRAGN